MKIFHNLNDNIHRYWKLRIKSSKPKKFPLMFRIDT